MTSRTVSWLLRKDDVLAAVETRHKGWAGDLRGAVVMTAPAVVHTLNSVVELDVAWCARVDGDDGQPCLQVRRTGCLGPRRLGRPQLGGGAIVVAAKGSFERWKLQIGDQLRVQEANRE